jgi:hypothetical protein
VSDRTWAAPPRDNLVYREIGAVAQEEACPFQNLKLGRREVPVEVRAIVPLGKQREGGRALTVADEPAAEATGRPPDRVGDVSHRADELATFVSPDVEPQGGDQHAQVRSSSGPRHP